MKTSQKYPRTLLPIFLHARSCQRPHHQILQLLVHPLALFIAYALHRTRLHSSVTFSALFLLQRLKARFPAARGSSGHRLFISAFMLASKVMCDDTYSNKSWSIVGQGMFALREINQMEREMCSYLEWQLNVDPAHLKEFEQKVRKDFRGSGPYPTYNLPTTATTPMPSTTPYTQGGAPQNPPSFVSGRPSAASTSPPKGPVHHHPISVAPLPPATVYPPASNSPGTPDTPEAYHSNSTSPASSGSPPTPPGHEDHTAKIVQSDPYPISSDSRVIPGAPQKSSRQRTSPSDKSKYNLDIVVGAAGVPMTTLDEAKLKQKTEFLAFAQPIDW
ncbi:hypothetical protein QCA50_005160 [Cerrena zonata]|uniref:Cyclin N-terminal domain-containing protein n=1 Tax=Cerrena zonata TaxID=2478898 RepID=A0AAW0GKU1_9APHY